MGYTTGREPKTSPAKTRRSREAADAEAPAPAALPAAEAALAAMLDQSDPTDGEEPEDQACLFEAEVVSASGRGSVDYSKLGWVRIVPGKQIYDDTKNRRFVIPREITSEDGVNRKIVVAYESEQYRADNLADYHRKRLRLQHEKNTQK